MVDASYGFEMVFVVFIIVVVAAVLSLFYMNYKLKTYS
jgi:hypothetical protein